MVVAEILTGIALVQKSVEFIKSNISTVNDISGIAKQIDGFFTGADQMNKKKAKECLLQNSLVLLKILPMIL